KLAWNFATNVDPDRRSADDALFLAQEACQATKSTPKAEFLDVLAAAQAESGRYVDAVATAKRALALASSGNGKCANAFQSRLHSYKARRPYRETPPGKR